jgi:hypothetical protein
MDPRLFNRRSMMPGMGEDPQGNAAPDGAFGLPPQDLINSLYDIFGAYPRKNVLPYSNGFELSLANGNQLLANGTARPTVITTADAAHVVTLITGTSTGAFTAFIRTDSSDRQLDKIRVHSTAIMGTAQRPFPLPKPLLLAPNTTLSFEIQDLSGANNDIFFTLWGFKVYRREYAAG